MLITNKTVIQWIVFTLASVQTASLVSAVAPDDPIDFASQIAPIFEKYCFECHGHDLREGGLRLTNRRDALAESDSGVAAIVPGDPTSSEILKRIVSHDESIRMPPDGDRLSKAEVAALRKWIADGARWPDTSNEKHWAYVPPRRPQIPVTANFGQPRNPIDHFILARLERKGIRPSADAPPATLLRRVSLALTGLPPTVGQVDAFLANPSEEAYEQFVDQCLQSPRYGERWAQPWLDLARYADSNGYQADQLRDSWAYRDWVIEALNKDMPFDQFTVEQLAGDLLPNATVDQKIATGFHRTVPCNVEAGVHPEENRVNQIFDRINTTGTVFLGTTIECCQCHNHKYDPFTQDEYYQLFAFFNNTPLEVKLQSGVQYDFYGPKINLPLSKLDLAKQKSLEQKLAALESQRKQLDAATKSSRESFRQTLIAAVETPVVWEPLSVIEFESSGGESHQILNDQSVLIGGSLPGTSIYKLTTKTERNRITAFRLEALTHESLPGMGPGRGDEIRTNFILSEFEVFAKAEIESEEDFEPVKLTNPTADFSQKNWNVAKSIDGNRTTGWAIAPKFSQPHHAIYRVKSPLNRPGQNTAYRFSLDQNFGRGRTLGRIRISATTSDVNNPAIPNEIKEILLAKKPNPGQVKKLAEFLDSTDPQKVKLNQEIAALKKQLDQLHPPTSLVMVEMDEMRDTFKLVRGEYLNPGKKVSPAVPEILHSMDDSLPRNRLGFARWIVDPANPLLSRVTVNRWWQELFGRGLVLSGEDFGTQADAPTHPDLLDWLSREFVENNWSPKHIHKLIVMSSAFRQNSRFTDELLERDPKNELYARGPRFRMPAEMIRDNGLAVSGLLSTKMGGPPVMPFQPDNIWRTVGRNAPKWLAATDQDRFRRGVYVVWRRAAPYPSFVNFDAPDRAACVVSRPRTNTPLQALTLLNDQTYLEMAIALADRVSSDQPDATAKQKITAAMRRCVLRVPEREEIAALTSLYEAELSRFASSPKLAQQFLAKYAIGKLESNLPENELAALAVVCNVMLNLDETVNY